MITGWVEFFKGKLSKNREFVSLDAKNPENPRPYELRKFEAISTPSAVAISGIASYPGMESTFRSDTPDHFSKETQREYKSPTLSFSSPRTMSRATTSVEWDPRSSQARGGLGLHPPEHEDKI